MARKKVNLQLITNSSTRRATYKKRCKGIMKKTSELATLCGIKACVVVYGEGEAQQPEVWPSASEARQVLKKFKDMPELGRFKKMQNQRDFLQGRITRLRDQVCKLDRENCEIETRDLLYESMEGRRPGLDGTTVEKLTSLSSLVEMKMARARELLQRLLVGQGRTLPNQPALFSSQPQASCTYHEIQGSAELEEFHSLEQEWLTNLVPNGGELEAMVNS
ncbi:unnamed protein product [Urochloa decumbens]|uniref:MADS-box domain-containing protein n=1 Tax=Urochloa decumbens TaxID=240449 RepID=A0ABC8YUV5_9POAL